MHVFSKRKLLAQKRCKAEIVDLMSSTLLVKDYSWNVHPESLFLTFSMRGPQTVKVSLAGTRGRPWYLDRKFSCWKFKVDVICCFSEEPQFEKNIELFIQFILRPVSVPNSCQKHFRFTATVGVASAKIITSSAKRRWEMDRPPLEFTVGINPSLA